MNYQKITVVLVVKALSEDDVVTELNQCIDLIEAEHFCRGGFVSSVPCEAPEGADEEEDDDDDDDDDDLDDLEELEDLEEDDEDEDENN